jgi:hypothetical protein
LAKWAPARLFQTQFRSMLLNFTGFGWILLNNAQFCSILLNIATPFPLGGQREHLRVYCKLNFAQHRSVLLNNAQYC